MNVFGALSGFLFVFIIVGGIAFFPVSLGPHVPKSLVPYFVEPVSNVAQQIAGCKTNWPLATDERILSDTYFNQTDLITDPEGLNVLTAIWGQFIAHDMLRGSTNTTEPSYTLGPLTLFRNNFKFVGDTQCREELLGNTPRIDASTVYGDYWNILSLRADTGASCKLQMSAGDLLPVLTPRSFLAGDERNTENSVLNSIHVIFAREHNRICDRLPHDWTEEEKYWKSRDIVIAKIQHITYTEWLPALFGSQSGLLNTVQERGDNTRVTSEFSLAAFRIGHSLIPDNIGQFSLLSMFFNVTKMQEHNVEPFLTAAAEEPALRVDPMVVNSLRNIMFMSPGNFGEDLVVRNLFRAREMTLNDYVNITDAFGGIPTNTYEDPLLGLLTEPLVGGSSLPKTIAIIIAEQFKRTRKYDPHYYLYNSWDIGREWIEEIMETTFSKIVRGNTQLKQFKNKAFFV